MKCSGQEMGFSPTTRMAISLIIADATCGRLMPLRMASIKISSKTIEADVRMFINAEIMDAGEPDFHFAGFGMTSEHFLLKNKQYRHGGQKKENCMLNLPSKSRDNAISVRLGWSRSPCRRFRNHYTRTVNNHYRNQCLPINIGG